MVKPLFSGLSTFTVLEGRFVEHIECRVSPFVDKDVITVDELEECFPLELRKGFYVGIRERIHPFQAVDLPQQFLPEASIPIQRGPHGGISLDGSGRLSTISISCLATRDRATIW